MSKQAQVGLFTLLGLAAIFAVFFVLSNFATLSQGYKIGVRYQSASGLRNGALVYLSGVPIGNVDTISLLEDYSTEVVMAINPGFNVPAGSKFLIQAPLTGEPIVLIRPPADLVAGSPTLPHSVLPLDQQPRGVNPTSVSDLLEEGQGEVKRLDTMLAELQRTEPLLLAQLSSALANANALTKNANESLTLVTSHFDRLSSSLDRNLSAASSNVADLTSSLDSVVHRNSSQIDGLLAQLSRTAKSFGETVDSLHDVATNPAVKKNLIDTSRDFALTAKTFAQLTGDLRNVTGNQQTQAQLRDTVAQIDATTQKVDSLVAELGGKSSVYGVDAGATPAPVATATPPGHVPTSAPATGPPATQPAAPGQTRGSGGPAGNSGPNRATAPAGLAALRKRLDSFTKDLVELQVRVGVLTPLRPGSANRNVSPLLTSDRGPESDFNLFVLPKAATGWELGVNDVGSGTSTANVLLVNRSRGFSYGAGILYSRLGVDASIARRALGLEARVYDLRHPTLDSYLNFRAAQKFQIFGGERDVTHASRRTVLGVQAEF